MNDSQKEVEIVEIGRTACPPGLSYRYDTSNYYDVSVCQGVDFWRIELVLKSFKEPVEKKFESKFFEHFVEEPKCFASLLDGEQVGWLELGFHKWNNTMRIWEILVRDGLRRRGLGKALIDKALDETRKKGARILVLETQSCNVPAINFYLKCGFKLIGFDSVAYSNSDIERKEVRLEFGLLP